LKGGNCRGDVEHEAAGRAGIHSRGVDAEQRIKDVIAETVDVLRVRWRTVESLAKALEKKTTLEASEIETILKA
jgi:hypothetical protein